MEAGLLTVDLDGKLTSLNEGGERILGWKTQEVLGKNLRMILKPEEAETLLSKPKQPGSLPYSRETVLTTKEGKKISIGFTATDRIDNQDKKVGNIVSFRDITLLKQMQTEVIRMDRLASLGILASGIAHEIKNPLAGIKTLAQTCLEEFEMNDPRIEYLTRIVRQVNRLDDLLKTVFAFARPKPPDRKFYKISDILQEVTNLVSKKMRSSDVQYIEKIEPELPEILVDAQQIQQVLLNLILNSVEAMPKGGILTFEAHLVNPSTLNNNRKGSKIHYLDRDPWVEIIIADTGIGIAPDKLEAIFDPFFTTKSSGLGLGLSIVYRIVEEHQGDIHVKSKPGKGTAFNILLPQGATE
jgi:PAS domain S-box-containing protein